MRSVDGRLPNDAYWVEPGRIMAGPYPGARDPAQVEPKLAALLDVGIRTFIDLTEEDEGLDPYAEVARDVAVERGVEIAHRRFPVQDVSIPTAELMREALAAIRATARDGALPYIHCWGGVGRTGTVVGCLLIEDGAAPDQVIARIRLLRAGTNRAPRRSPETEAQEQFVLAWAAGSTGEGLGQVD